MNPGKVGWEVVEGSPGKRLRLQRTTHSDRFDFARRVVTSGGALVTAIALGAASSQFVGAELVLWPMSAGLGLVAVLGVLASMRAWRRLRSGVFLDAVKASRSVTGFPRANGLADDSRPITATFEQVEAIELTTYAGGQASVALTVLLRSGERLEGPALSSTTSDPPNASHLRNLADELGNLCGCPVRAAGADDASGG